MPACSCANLHINRTLMHHSVYADIALHILNTEFFGYIMQNEKYKDITEASEKFFHFKLNMLGKL